MKKRRISKVVALALTLVMSLSLAFYNNADVAEAASNTVTFMNGSTTVDTESVNSGSAVANIGALEADGKLFAGWFTQNVGDITDVSSALSYAYDFSSAVDSDKTLYAGWINIGTDESSDFYLMGTQNRPVTDTTTAGLRFMTKITDSLVEDLKALNSANSDIRPTSSAQTGIGYGTVLTYAENLADGSMLVKDTSATTVGSGFYIVPAVKTYTLGSDYRIYTAMVVGIPEAYYSQHIAARPYITYADANGETQTYYYTETSDTTHKAGGSYYLNYSEAVDNYTCNDTIDVEQPSTEAPTTAYDPAYTGGYNLTVTDIKWNPETIVTGSQVVWTVTVMNNGDTDIEAGTTIGYQVQVDGRTDVITWCDNYSGGLKAGQSIELTCNGGTTGNYWTATQGSHSVMAWVDDVDRLGSEVNENDSDNQYTVNINVQNTVTTTQATQATTAAPTTEATTAAPVTTQAATEAASQYVPVYTGGYDLTVTALNWEPSNPSAGNAVVFTATIMNDGDTDIPSGTTIGYQIQIDGSTSPIWWCDTYNGGLKAGESVELTCNSGTNSVNYWNATSGSHSVMAWVDDVNRFASEVNENNNQYTTSIYVQSSSSSGSQTTTEAATPDSGSTADGRVIGYNVPSGKATSSNVSMTANGVSVGVFDTAVNNTHTWVGYWPSLSTARVAIFDFEGTAKVTLTVNYSVNSATIRPVGDGITPTITRNGNTSYITFSITQAGQYSVELNGNLTDAIMIFASAIEDKPTGNVRTISGEYNGDITVTSGQTLYIEGGAAVYGRIFCQSNSTVAGRGIIDGSKYDGWAGTNAKYPMSIEFVSNVNVSGVSVLNSNCWNYQIYNSSNVTLDNIKIVSARPNGDGVSIQSSSYVYVKNSFIRTWDDGIVLKNYSSNNTHHVYCDNVVFWTDLAQAMEIGVETNAGYAGTPANPAIYEVEFTNMDIIHALHKAAISIHNGDNAEIYNIKWENITMEDCSPGQGDGWNYWLDFTTCYPTNFGGSAAWAHNWDGTGTIHDVTLRNIQITSSTNAGHRVWDWWASQNTGYSIYNITCENIYVNGSAFKY